jgi:hypothetical protein
MVYLKMPSMWWVIELQNGSKEIIGLCDRQPFSAPSSIGSFSTMDDHWMPLNFG